MTTIRIQRYIAAVSVVLFAGKLWAWYLTQSVSILTDALESTVNVIAAFIGLYSVTLAAKPRDANHPYGHGKIEFVSAAVEGSLIVTASLMIAYQAIAHLIHPLELQQLDMGIIITGATGLANFLLGQYAVTIGRKERSATVEAAGRHPKSDAYSTVAIIVGLMLVLFTREPRLDPLVALTFSTVIFVTGYKVLRKSLAGIMDEADERLLQEVVDVLQRHRRDEWIDLHNLRVIQYGDVLHVDAHMTLPYYVQVRQAEQEVNALEDLIRDHFGSKVELFIHIDGCEFFQCKLCSVKSCPVRQEEMHRRLDWNVDNVMANSKHGRSG